MSSETHEESHFQSLRCYWPEKFTKRRKFDRRTENEPYIDYLRTQFLYGEEDEHEDDVSSSENEDDSSNEPEEEVERHQHKSDDQGENQNIDKDTEACNLHSDIRAFMTGDVGDEDALENHDQVDVVASFCEEASFMESETKPGQDRKCVALLDDRNIDGTIADKKGQCRSYSGPLTSHQLREKLSKNVTQISCQCRGAEKLTYCIAFQSRVGAKYPYQRI